MGGPGSGARPKVYPPELVARVAELYASGKTQAEVAAAVGTSQKVVYRVMLRSGIAARQAKARQPRRGPDHPSWKPGDVTYAAFHYRVYASRGRPTVCSTCGVSGPGRSYDWANLTGRYDDLDDYAPMCRSCHWRYDDKVANLRGRSEGGDAK